MEYPFDRELKDLLLLWQSARTELKALKSTLLSAGKSAALARKNKEYRLLKKRIKTLSVKRGQINKKRSMIIEKERKSDER